MGAEGGGRAARTENSRSPARLQEPGSQLSAPAGQAIPLTWQVQRPPVAPLGHPLFLPLAMLTPPWAWLSSGGPPHCQPQAR